ncbi:MAG: ABC transporter substrate-binding protein [Candidatus ainarchaeum sp.]|nr:ABC transporter substrate-binding protein [Candidatus ainarchaeum sp.]
MKVNLKIIIGIVVVCVIAAIILATSLTAKGSEVVKFGYLPVVQGSPLYLAVEEGYFEEVGIEVELTSFDSPNQIIDAFLQGQIDIGPPSIAAGITGIAETKNPGKMKIYALAGGDKNNGAANLFVTPDSEIKEISELKGKKVGILGGTIQWRTIAREIFAQNGLDMDKDLIIFELAPGLQVQALASKQIDALLALEPVSTVVKNKGVGKILVSAPCEKLIAEPFYAGAGVISTKFLKESPETAKKVIEIMEKAIKAIKEDPELERKYLSKYTSVDDVLAQKVPNTIFKMYSEFDEKDFEAVQKFYDIFKKYNVVDSEINFKNFVYTEN